MSNAIIKVEGLGKSYLIGHQREKGYVALRDVVTNKAKNFAKGIKDTIGGKQLMGNQEVEEFWALKDINFEIKQGEAVGIIGRNGAGKSTLLKVLSRITEPTKGRIELNGRVASLLEVGTGFHPELSGRENIYLNGAILGMQRSEIKSKFDEIVDFSGVEKFLDTPVKRYSSGMYVRLAFAVAAHLEPEILVVDEVLAVGDAEFQKKCLGKMNDVSKKEGRTVLFVSHNMSAIQNLCSTAILMNKGQIQRIGGVDIVIQEYNQMSSSNYGMSLKERKDRHGTGKIRVTQFYLQNENNERLNNVKSGDNFQFVMEFENKSYPEKFRSVEASIALIDTQGQVIFLVRSNFTNENLNIHEQHGKIICGVKNLAIANGTYSIMLYLGYAEAEIYDLIENAMPLTVEGGDYFGTGSAGLPAFCKVLTKAKWDIN